MTNKEKLNTSIDLLNQIIKMESLRDEEHKKYWASQKKYSKSVGESSILFHLKALKELISELE
jgi:hypothetical protein